MMPYSSGPKTPARSGTAGSSVRDGVLGARPTHAGASHAVAAIIATSPPMLHPRRTGARRNVRASETTSAA